MDPIGFPDTPVEEEKAKSTTPELQGQLEVVSNPKVPRGLEMIPCGGWGFREEVVYGKNRVFG